jgi:hypothetical protein
MKLEAAFGRERLFMDVEGYIQPGDDFVKVLDSQVEQCDALLAIIGPRWLGIKDGQDRRRLDNPDDFVRIEIVSALARGKRVIPIVVNNAQPPKAENLPEDLKPLARRNAVPLSHERFGSDCERIIKAVQQALQKAEEARRVAAENLFKEFNDALQKETARRTQSAAGLNPAPLPVADQDSRRERAGSVSSSGDPDSKPMDEHLSREEFKHSPDSLATAGAQTAPIPPSIVQPPRLIEPSRPETASFGPVSARAPAPNHTWPPPPTDEGLKRFRSVVAKAETLDQTTAHGSPSAREASAPKPSGNPTVAQIPPAEAQRAADATRPVPPRPPPLSNEGRKGSRDVVAEAEGGPSARGLPAVVPPDVPNFERSRASVAALTATVLAILIVGSTAGALYWWREPIKSWFAVVRLPIQGQVTDQNSTHPKILDRVGPPSAQADKGAGSAPVGKDGQAAAVAQRVVLYEEDPAGSQGKRMGGSAIWRTETVSPGPGQAPELAIRADLEIPERSMKATMSIRRNTDQVLPASHTIELMFNIPTDFPFGGIGNVPTILMKQAEQARGTALAGLVVKVTPTFFLVGLSSGEGDVQRNIELLKERSWFDIPVVYTNGRRAILAVEKGAPGDHAFAEAFAAWSTEARAKDDKEKKTGKK